MMVVKANSQVWPNLEERHMLQLSGGSEEKDWKQVSSSCPAHPSTFHWRWHRGERSTYNFSKHINTGGWWWLPDEPGSTKPAGGWESPSYLSNSWKHLWSPAHVTQGEQWGIFSLQWGDAMIITPQNERIDGLAQNERERTFVPGAWFHGRGLPAEMGPDAPQHK